MSKLLTSLAAASFLTCMAGAALAHDTTVIHKESADGSHSKTVVATGSGSKTIIKHRKHRVNKVHIHANGDTTIIKKN